MDWVFGFHHYQYILWRQCLPVVVLWVTHLIHAKFFLIWEKTQAWSVGRDAWVCSKVMQHGLSSCHLWPVIKIGPFSSCMKNTKCLHTLPAWKETQTLLCPWLWTWLTCWNHCKPMAWISLTNLGILIKMIWVMLPSCYTFVIITGFTQLFLNPQNCSEIDTHWNLHICASSMNAN